MNIPAGQKTRRATEPIPWHTAFDEALGLHFEPWKHMLEFSFEHQLTEGPLRMDVLVIKKLGSGPIRENIAEIFRESNIFEYKSPRDYISVGDFYKVYGYACFYASLNRRDIASLTVSLVCSRQPAGLLRHLREARGYGVEEVHSGIYRVTGDIIPVQIIQTKRLSAEGNLWLKGLSEDLDISQAGAILKESAGKGKGARIHAYLNAVLLANPRAVEEALKMRNGALTLEKVLRDAGLTEKWKAEGKAEGEALGEARGKAEGKEEKALEIARNLIQRGWSVEETAETTDLSIDRVKALCRPRRKRASGNR
jgi:hypothetical protein